MSQDYIDDINSKVSQLAGNRHSTLEDIFNLGVQFGRYLEKNDLTNIRLRSFEQIEQETQLKVELIKLHETVCALLERLVKVSIKDQINQSSLREWSIGFNEVYGTSSEFDPSVVEKRCVQFSSVERGEGDHFIAHFFVQGKLRDLFEKHKQPDQFEIIVDNDHGYDSVSITEERQIDALNSCMIFQNCERSKSGVEGYTKFVNDLKKSLLFMYLE